ncbi:DUF6705 family protein [Flavobacterium sp.]|uniref:DUF6705 family protein n=1 Tax=Flavobacterium sp. TaxID=239 RepID=UPI0037527D49
MKKIFILIIIIVTAIKSYSQVEVAVEEQFIHDEENPYLKDLNGVMDKFEGEWLFTDPTHYLKIKFYKIEYVDQIILQKHEIYDELRSFILYKELQLGIWVTIYNTFPATFTQTDLDNQNFNAKCIHGNLVSNSNNNEVNLFYFEPLPVCSIKENGNLKLTYTNNSGIEQLQWDYGIIHGRSVVELCSNNNNNIFIPYKIPIQITLNKI